VRNSYPVRADAPQRLVLSTEMGSVRVDEGPSMRPATQPAPDANSSGSQADAPPPTDPPRPSREDPELDRILKMVEAGELSAQDADELLRAMGRV
jgi:hypothetical protein